MPIATNADDIAVVEQPLENGWGEDGIASPAPNLGLEVTMIVGPFPSGS
jgi:hypothetical protein